jgi:hypothetical protein
MKKLIIILGAITVSLTSCLKDKPNVDFSNIGAFAELVHSGIPYFGDDAITDAGDGADLTITRTVEVNVTGVYAPTKDVTVTVALDNSIIAPYNAANPAVTYLPMPAGSFVFATTTVTIKAGTRVADIPVTFYKAKLDPSKSYMLPLKLTTSNIAIAANYNIKYFHFIGNDFAGTYTWKYHRWQNGTGPGSTNIPWDIDNTTDDAGLVYPTAPISPITATEFEMTTGYNGQGVKYDVSFTRTVDASNPSLVHYSDWTVKFTAANIAKWTAAGITNMVPPKFTIPPPSDNTKPKIFELNYVSGGAFGRYIDDTYSK